MELRTWGVVQRDMAHAIQWDKVNAKDAENYRRGFIYACEVVANNPQCTSKYWLDIARKNCRALLSGHI